MTVRAVIQGCGHYLPKRVVDNSEFERTLDTSDDWISSRSGIKRRHFANEDETTSVMATLAAKEALADANLQADDVGWTMWSYERKGRQCCEFRLPPRTG